MKNWLWILYMTAAIAAPAVTGAARPAVAIEKLVIASEIYPPLSTAEKNGFEDLLAKEIFRRLGIAVEIRHMPGERVLANVNAGLQDGVHPRIGGMAEKYPNLVQFEERSLVFDFVAFTRMGDLEIVDWASLAPYHVGIVTGWKILEWNIKQNKSLIKVDNGEQLFKMLGAGRIDVAVYARWPGLQLVRDLGLEDIRDVDPPFATKDAFAYLHKRHERLIPKASQVLRAMKADGTYQRIYDQTLGKFKAN